MGDWNSDNASVADQRVKSGGRWKPAEKREGGMKQRPKTPSRQRGTVRPQGSDVEGKLNRGLVVKKGKGSSSSSNDDFKTHIPEQCAEGRADVSAHDRFSSPRRTLKSTGKSDRKLGPKPAGRSPRHAGRNGNGTNNQANQRGSPSKTRSLDNSSKSANQRRSPRRSIGGLGASTHSTSNKGKQRRSPRRRSQDGACNGVHGGNQRLSQRDLFSQAAGTSEFNKALESEVMALLLAGSKSPNKSSKRSAVANRKQSGSQRSRSAARHREGADPSNKKSPHDRCRSMERTGAVARPNNGRQGKSKLRRDNSQEEGATSDGSPTSVLEAPTVDKKRNTGVQQDSLFTSNILKQKGDHPQPLASPQPLSPRQKSRNKQPSLAARLRQQNGPKLNTDDLTVHTSMSTTRRKRLTKTHGSFGSPVKSRNLSQSLHGGSKDQRRNSAGAGFTMETSFQKSVEAYPALAESITFNDSGEWDPAFTDDLFAGPTREAPRRTSSRNVKHRNDDLAQQKNLRGTVSLAPDWGSGYDPFEVAP